MIFLYEKLYTYSICKLFFNSKEGIEAVNKLKRFSHDKYLHRLDGPAEIWIGSDGNVFEQYYFINGKQIADYAYWNHPEVMQYTYLNLWK